MRCPMSSIIGVLFPSQGWSRNPWEGHSPVAPEKGLQSLSTLWSPGFLSQPSLLERPCYLEPATAPAQEHIPSRTRCCPDPAEQMAALEAILAPHAWAVRNPASDTPCVVGCGGIWERPPLWEPSHHSLPDDPCPKIPLWVSDSLSRLEAAPALGTGWIYFIQIPPKQADCFKIVCVSFASYIIDKISKEEGMEKGRGRKKLLRRLVHSW